MPTRAWLCEYCRAGFTSYTRARRHEMAECEEAQLARLRADRRRILYHLARLMQQTMMRDLARFIRGMECRDRPGEGFWADRKAVRQREQYAAQRKKGKKDGR